jgi:hypothetical protein
VKWMAKGKFPACNKRIGCAGNAIFAWRLRGFGHLLLTAVARSFYNKP